jgi:hypothetical protein
MENYVETMRWYLQFTKPTITAHDILIETVSNNSLRSHLPSNLFHGETVSFQEKRYMIHDTPMSNCSIFLHTHEEVRVARRCSINGDFKKVSHLTW